MEVEIATGTAQLTKVNLDWINMSIYYIGLVTVLFFIVAGLVSVLKTFIPKKKAK